MARTVLIVDDHPTFRGFARRLLEAAGFEVVGEATDGASALDRAAELSPEVVLLDLMLPDVSGLEVADRLAVMSPHARVVLVSSRSADDFGAALRVRAERFVRKDDLVLARLEQLLGGGD